MRSVDEVYDKREYLRDKYRAIMERAKSSTTDRIADKLIEEAKDVKKSIQVLSWILGKDVDLG